MSYPTPARAIHEAIAPHAPLTAIGRLAGEPRWGEYVHGVRSPGADKIAGWVEALASVLIEEGHDGALPELVTQGADRWRYRLTEDARACFGQVLRRGVTHGQ